MAITSEQIHAEFEEQQLIGRIAETRAALRRRWDTEGFGPDKTVDLWLNQLTDDIDRLAKLEETEH